MSLPPRSAAAALLRVVTTEEGSPYPKASLILRGLARAVDTAIAWGLYFAPGGVGGVASLLFLLLADGMVQGQSPGKKLFGVRVVYLPTRAFGRYRDSVLRNAPFGLIVLLTMLPEGLGRVAFLAGVTFIGGIEAVKVFREALGMRWGDAWAQTQVVDGKVPAGALTAARAPEVSRVPGRIMSVAGGNKCESRSRTI